MIKLNLNDEPLTISHASPSVPGTGRRLMILVPGPEADLTSVTRRVWELAHATGAQVRFLGLCNNAEDKLVLQRTLVTASALMNSGGTTSDWEIVVSKNWLDTVRLRLRPSDMLVSSQGPGSGSHQKSLNAILQADLGVPLYILSGTQTQNTSGSEWLQAAAAWIGSLAILIAFFWLQVKIDQLAGEWSIPLQVLSTALEFALIWNWNRKFK
jgi:hypothetical protein